MLMLAYNSAMVTSYRHRSLPPSGFTILETIIGTTILTVVTLALFAVMSANLTSLFQGKARGIALAIAQEKMEDLKNLPYDSLSTKSGTIYPAGTIPDSETITRNGLKFNILIDIRYIDNPYDGDAAGTVQGKPADLYSYDYKKVTVQILNPSGTTQLAKLSTDIAAKAAETAGNTGVLLIKVINAAGSPVENASVQITNTNPNPDVSISTTTDIQGQVIIPKLPPDSSPGYHVVVSKAGFNSEQTYAIDAQHPTPVNPDFAMLAQQITTKTFAIDQLGNLSLNVVDPSGNPLVNQSVTIHGQRQTNNSPVVYKVNSTSSTDAYGQAQFNLIDWDSYSISITGYTILSTSPLSPITVSPNSLLSATVVASTTPTLYPVISTITPTGLTPGPGTNVDITGANISASTSVILRKDGEADRIPTNIIFTSPDSLNTTFDLTTANGSYDLIITTSGRSTIQSKAITVSP